ncbi:MAG: hypothetical protein AAF171_19755 [Cyanobacteria bacterium P01_A01_bin.116]
MKCFSIAPKVLAVLLLWPAAASAQDALPQFGTSPSAETSLPTPSSLIAPETPLPPVIQTPLPARGLTPVPAVTPTTLPVATGPGVLFVESAGRARTVLAFQASDYQVQVSRLGEAYVMSVFNQRTSQQELNEAPAVIANSAQQPYIAGKLIFTAQSDDFIYTAYASPSGTRTLRIAPSDVIDEDRSLRISRFFD